MGMFEVVRLTENCQVTNDLRIVKCYSSVHFRCLCYKQMAFLWRMSLKWAGLFVSKDMIDITHKHCWYVKPSERVGGLYVFAPLKLDKHLTSSDQENESKVSGVTYDLKHRRKGLCTILSSLLCPAKTGRLFGKCSMQEARAFIYLSL